MQSAARTNRPPRADNSHTGGLSGIFSDVHAAGENDLTFFAACGRLSRSRSEYAALRGKLDDARLINRAKLLLISRLKMSEDEAHRFLERSAMDGCMKLRTVAESIIRTYEE